LSYWKESKGEIEEYNLSKKYGQCKTEHEYKLNVCALYMLLNTYIKVVAEKQMKARDTSWNKMYVKVASHLHVRKYHVAQLHQQMIEDGDILVFGEGEGSKRGPKEHVHCRLNQQQVQSIVDKVEEYHSNRKTIINRTIQNFVLLEYRITYSKRLGLTWKKVMNKKRTVGEYCKICYIPSSLNSIGS
jgi:hypothetical protein